MNDPLLVDCLQASRPSRERNTPRTNPRDNPPYAPGNNPYDETCNTGTSGGKR